jgi:very-short-patch-repair endonuclease
MILESPMEELFWNTARECGFDITYIMSKHHSDRNLVPQYQVGPYRLDFAMPGLKLGFEIDGYDYHSGRHHYARDRARQRAIERLGWRVIRFAAAEVYHDPYACMNEVAAARKQRLAEIGE